MMTTVRSRRLLAVVLSVALANLTAEAKLEFGSPFADGAVLQRGKMVNVWGWTDPGGSVKVAFAGTSVAATADADGRWLAQIGPFDACCEGRILSVSSGSERIEARDVLVGEVWLCSGQSNMEFSLCSGAVRLHERDGFLTAQMTHKPLIRYLHGCRYRTSVTPQERAEGRFFWEKFEPKLLMRHGVSAIAVHYALELHSALGVPIGVMVAAWGGTDIAPWIPKCGLVSVKGLEDIAAWNPKDAKSFAESDKTSTMTNPNRQPTVIYNGLVAPLVPYTMRGIVWYQGESDRGDALRYALKMHAYYKGMTEVFRDRSLKLYFAQISCWRHGGSSWNDIRLQQAKFAAEEPNAEMVVTADVGNPDEIHPYDKKPVAKRLAAYALRNDYGFSDIVCDQPVPADVTAAADGTVEISFRHAKELRVYNLTEKANVEFELAGTDGEYKAAEIVSEPMARRKNQYAGPSLKIRANGVPRPVTVRYLYQASAQAALLNELGLPAGPFVLPVRPQR